VTTHSAPASGDDWVGVGATTLPAAEAMRWSVLASCGAVVSFAGTSRDHATAPDGTRRDGVTILEYEAYDEQVVLRLGAVAAELRRRWPTLGRIVLLHRLGAVPVAEASVLVVVSAPHRAEAFAAASLGIDAIKATVPIWKRESWPGGTDYGLDAHPVDDISTFAGGPATAGLAAGAPTAATSTIGPLNPSDAVRSCRT
jgi:molybdopterin synthase catalytic subunit